MTKIYYIGMVLLAAVMAGCTQKQNPDDKSDGDEPHGPRTVTLTVSLEDVKAAADAQGKMTWQEGDQIGVLQEDLDVVPFTLSSGAGTTFATFTRDYDDDGLKLLMAGYPYWDSAWEGYGDEIAGYQLVFNSNSAVAWKGNESVSAIMMGEINGDSVSFTHQGGVLHFPIKDVPSGARKFKFTASNNAVYGSSTFVLNFTPVPGVMDFYVPVSAGTIPSYTISLCDAAENAIISKTKSSSTTIERCELRDLTPLQVVESNKIRIVTYNAEDGMVADKNNNYNNFVAWVNSMAPDIMILCEAEDHDNDYHLDALASRWGHSRTEIVDRDSYPVVVTSSRPMSTRKIINNGTSVSHGAIYVSVAGLDLVALHLRPTQDKGTEQPNKYEYYGAQRVEELNYILSQTINNASYSSQTDWVFLGDFNMMAYSEKTATGAVGGAAYNYPDYEGNRSVAYNVYDNMCATGLKDVLYDFNGGIFQPTMYHGRSRLDYIFAAPSVYSRVRAASVVRGGFPGNYTTASSNPNPSDHLPLVMDLSDFSFKVLDGKTRLEDWGEENLFSEYLN